MLATDQFTCEHLTVHEVALILHGSIWRARCRCAVLKYILPMLQHVKCSVEIVMFQWTCCNQAWRQAVKGVHEMFISVTVWPGTSCKACPSHVPPQAASCLAMWQKKLLLPHTSSSCTVLYHHNVDCKNWKVICVDNVPILCNVCNLVV